MNCLVKLSWKSKLDIGEGKVIAVRSLDYDAEESSKSTTYI